MEQESSESFRLSAVGIKVFRDFWTGAYGNVSSPLVFRGRIYGFLKAPSRGPYIVGTENRLLEVAWLEMEQKLVKRIARPALLRAASNNNS